MFKKIAMISVTTLIILGLLVTGVSAVLKSRAQEHHDTTSEIMIEISELWKEVSGDIEYLEGDNETLRTVIKEYEVLIKGRDESIEELRNQVIERDAIIESLKDDSELEEALSLMQAIETQAKELRDSIKNSN